jgi:hypothetical protein
MWGLDRVHVNKLEDQLVEVQEMDACARTQFFKSLKGTVASCTFAAAGKTSLVI